VIQWFWRRTKPRNTTCSLTLEEIDALRYQKQPIFRFYPDPKKGQPIGYSLKAVLQNIAVTGKMQDPCTRTDYSTNDLRRIDALMTAYGLHGQFESPLKLRQKKIDELVSQAALMFRFAQMPSDAVLVAVLKPLIYETFTNVSQTLHELAVLDPNAAQNLVGSLAARIRQTSEPFRVYTNFLDETFDTFLCAMRESV